MQNRKKTERFLKNSADNFLLILSFLGSAALAKNHAGISTGFFNLAGWEIYFLICLCLAWNVGARAFGLYDEFRFQSLIDELSVLGENILMQVFLAMAILFVVKTKAFSRYFVFAYCILLLALLVLCKLLLRLLLTWLQKKGHNQSHILIVGHGEVARSFFDTVAVHAYLGYRVMGFIAEQPLLGLENLYRGSFDHLARVLEDEKIDEVIIALPNSATKKIGQVIDVCENYPTQIRIIPDYFKFMSPRFGVSRFASFPLISIRAHPLEKFHWRLLKRSFDVGFSLLLFVTVFSWLWPLLIVLVKISSPGPVFFKQERWGIKNTPIICYKFRSMVPESRDVDAHGRYQQASRTDKRITRLGGFLRRRNLDELPQFINVLKGDMSVVGPRPHPTPMNLEVKDSIHHYHLRHLVKPGITGWAQINGYRGETSDPEALRKRVEFDIWYIENWSILLDVKIILSSIWLMLKGDSRAY
ncbi:MAG: undecaprenyl-phosphate glucose phosphotransferase [Candidatus Aminicenantes bacterium]|nr:undecaprenyl-phosphate glucose phosphotransferase [Candidatus Aminicenantes bacterium]